jgi:hypothetical protein
LEKEGFELKTEKKASKKASELKKDNAEKAVVNVKQIATTAKPKLNKANEKNAANKFEEVKKSKANDNASKNSLKKSEQDLQKQSGPSFFKRLNKFLNLFVDIVLYPLIILTILTSVISVTARDKKEIKSFFGYSIVTVLTPSMEAGGFMVGDVVFLKSKPIHLLRPAEFEVTLEENEEGKLVEVKTFSQLGDVIAFYNFKNKYQPSLSALKKVDFDNLPTPTEEQSLFPKDIKKQAVDAEVDVIFHRIIGVYMAKDGTYFFKTQGDSNKSDDNWFINENLVVGSYVKAAQPITDVLTYMVTPSGMFWAIIVPLAVIVFLQIIELMTIVFDIATEKKVLSGELPFDSEESLKANIGRDMMDYNKIYLYDITPIKDKESVKEFLWDMNKKADKTKKEILNNEKVEQSLLLYEENRDKFWDFWMSDKKGSKLEKLKKLRRNATIIIKSRQLSEKNSTKEN